MKKARGNIVVKTLEDELNADGDCSLQEAIESPNTNAPADGCAAEEVMTDTIIFEVSGVITVTSQLEVEDGGLLLIDGGGVITTSWGGNVAIWMTSLGSQLTLRCLMIMDGYTYDSEAGFVNDVG